MKQSTTDKPLVSEENMVRATHWYLEHCTHVDKLIKTTDKAYPPSNNEDARDPRLWKAEHWKWFVNDMKAN